MQKFKKLIICFTIVNLFLISPGVFARSIYFQVRDASGSRTAYSYKGVDLIIDPAIPSYLYKVLDPNTISPLYHVTGKYDSSFGILFLVTQFDPQNSYPSGTLCDVNFRLVNGTDFKVDLHNYGRIDGTQMCSLDTKGDTYTLTVLRHY